MRRVILIGLTGLLSACSALPAAGPRTSAIVEAGQRGEFRFVELDAAGAEALAASVPRMDGEHVGMLPRARRALGVLHPGDALRVSVWENSASATTLTSDRPPTDVVSRVGLDGTVSVPYVPHRIRAAGMTPARLESTIRSALDAQARGFQVSVNVTEDVGGGVTVSGDVTRPGRISLQPSSRMLTDVLAMAGGSRSADRISLARVRRDGHVATRDLRTLAETPSADIELAPGDRVFVTRRDDAVFHAFGSVGRPGEQAIDFGDPTLARALSRVAGLDRQGADSTAVFLYRRETRNAPATVHRLNLREPNGFILADRVRIVSGDIIYVGEAPVAEIAKVIQLVTGAGSALRSVGGAIPGM